jgi:hypothetical protein
LTTLRSLWLSDNALSSLPADLDYLPVLTELELDGNPCLGMSSHALRNHAQEVLRHYWEMHPEIRRDGSE